MAGNRRWNARKGSAGNTSAAKMLAEVLNLSGKDADAIVE
jgi:shikimate kinase